MSEGAAEDARAATAEEAPTEAEAAAEERA